MNTGLHPVEAVRFTASNDYACSLCGFRIPTRKTSRNTEELREWQSAEVAGLFCSELCAHRATADRLYRAKYSFEGVI
jgi:hypothetical protein